MIVAKSAVPLFGNPGLMEANPSAYGWKGVAMLLALSLHLAVTFTLWQSNLSQPTLPAPLTSFEFVVLPEATPEPTPPPPTTEITEAPPPKPLPAEIIPPPPPPEPLEAELTPPPEVIPVQPPEPVVPVIKQPEPVAMLHPPSPQSKPRVKPRPPAEVVKVAKKVEPLPTPPITPTTLTNNPPVKQVAVAPTRHDAAPPAVMEKPVSAVKPAETYTPPSSRAGYLNNPKPLYPKLARRRGMEGQVLLTVEVDERGEPLQVKVKQGSGHAILDRSALKAVKKWRFVPARRGQMAIRASVEIPIRFSLLNS
ncbi:MAG: energy transducer TonB [Magnetococcales bacterium]|nr:energy transducer TonB [Magnetococcales bacterium]